MFYIKNKNGIYPLTSSLRIIELNDMNEENVYEDGNRTFFCIKIDRDTICAFKTKEEAQDLIEKIQEAINDGKNYYYVNEM